MLNPRQKIVVMLGALALLGLFLFPPHIVPERVPQGVDDAPLHADRVVFRAILWVRHDRQSRGYLAGELFIGHTIGLIALTVGAALLLAGPRRKMVGEVFE